MRILIATCNHMQLRNLVDSTIKRDNACVQIVISCLSTQLYQILTKFTASEISNTKTYRVTKTAPISTVSLEEIANSVEISKQEANLMQKTECQVAAVPKKTLSLKESQKKVHNKQGKVLKMRKNKSYC